MAEVVHRLTEIYNEAKKHGTLNTKIAPGREEFRGKIREARGVDEGEITAVWPSGADQLMRSQGSEKTSSHHSVKRLSYSLSQKPPEAEADDDDVEEEEEESFVGKGKNKEII